MWWRNVLWDLFGRGANSRIEALIAAGYLLGLPVLIWTYLDLRRLHRPRWDGSGNRDQWQLGAAVTYLAFGWPVVLIAVGWRTSRTRAAVVGECARVSSRPTIST